jgi:hypothetical protein
MEQNKLYPVTQLVRAETILSYTFILTIRNRPCYVTAHNGNSLSKIMWIGVRWLALSPYVMGTIVSIPKFICWSLYPQYLRMWLYLEIEPLKRWFSWNEVIRKNIIQSGITSENLDTWRDTKDICAGERPWESIVKSQVEKRGLS